MGTRTASTARRMRSATDLPNAAWQDDGEFLATKAHQGVHGAHTVGQHAAHGLQHLVASHVAMGVVDVFEVVDVQHQQQGCFARTGHTVQFTVDDREKLAAVGQTGEWIFERQLAQTVNEGLQIASRLSVCRQLAGTYQCARSFQLQILQGHHGESLRSSHENCSKV